MLSKDPYRWIDDPLEPHYAPPDVVAVLIDAEEKPKIDQVE